MPQQRQQSFQELLAAAIADIADHGFDSIERIERWTRELRVAAERSLISAESLEEQLRTGLAAEYRKMVDQGGVLKFHSGIERFTIDRIRPALRGELDRRIMASANLIKLNRTEAVEKTLRRFQGWATSIPKGGVSGESKREVKANVRKSLAQLPFEERRVLVDQGHKLVASISELLAADGGAIAGIWHSHWRQAGYNYRPDHKDRDEKTYLIRDSWAHQAGLVKKGRVGYYDESTAPGQEPFCRCLGPTTQIFDARGISVLSRRDYNGPCLEIVTAAMPERPLMITPNHPVLTMRGWVAAQTLNVGDDLIELVQKYIPARVRVNDEEDRPPTISEIFDSLAKTSGIRSIGDSRVQFHGDGIPDGDVDIVRPARLLSFSVDSPYCRKQFSLAKPNRNSFSHRSIYTMLNGLFSALHDSLRKMSGKFAALSFAEFSPPAAAGFALFEHSNFPTFRAALLMPNYGGVRVRPDFDVGLPQSSSDRGIADFELLCQRHGIPAGQIRTTKIIEIKRDRFSGHVYNLQTDGEWYSANRIISHNCYYSFLYNLRDLPADMLTAKGKTALGATQAEIRASTARTDSAAPAPRPVVGYEAHRIRLARLTGAA